MRPGVQASVMRSHAHRVKRIRPAGPHRFSLRRLLTLVFIGTVLFISGVALTVLGYEKAHAGPNLSQDQQVMYRALGPVGCVVGTALLLGSCMYYYCYGTGDGFGPRPPQSPATTSTTYHPISSIRSTNSNAQHRHHNDGHHGHQRHHHPDNSTSHYDDAHDGMVPLTNEYLADHNHHHIIITGSSAPLAASENASIRETPSAVQSEISITVEHAHKHPSTTAPPPTYDEVTNAVKA